MALFPLFPLKKKKGQFCIVRKVICFISQLLEAQSEIEIRV